MNKLYPLKFTPIFKDKIWGGQKINTKLGLNYGNLPNCGEAWVLSGVAGNQTRVSNGFLAGNDLNEILEIYMDELVGEHAFEMHGNEFPILIKFIDANDNLSIQVHPGDELAAIRGVGSGKSEMWYVLDADPGAELITGFNRKVSREEYLECLHHNNLPEILNVEKVEAGDTFFIPAGRVHALGPGILLAEIQQTSDTTYRIYDWDRMDGAGKPRELHTELALDAIDFNFYNSYRTHYTKSKNKTVPLIDSPHFTTQLLDFREPIRKDYGNLDSFVLLICVKGNAQVHYDQGMISLTLGEVVLVPAIMDHIFLLPEPECRLLEVFINPKY